jgi:mRNA interferase MazF
VRIPGWPVESQERPALIVSVDVRNRLANDVIVVPLTTTLRRAPTHVELQAGEGGILQRSMAKCEQITTLPKQYLLRGPFAGAVSSQTLGQVERALQTAIGILPSIGRK